MAQLLNDEIAHVKRQPPSFATTPTKGKTCDHIRSYYNFIQEQKWTSKMSERPLGAVLHISFYTIQNYLLEICGGKCGRGNRSS